MRGDFRGEETRDSLWGEVFLWVQGVIKVAEVDFKSCVTAIRGKIIKTYMR